MHGLLLVWAMNECTEPGMYLIQCTQTQGGIPTTPRSALGSWLIVPEGMALEDVSPIPALSLRNGPSHGGGLRAHRLGGSTTNEVPSLAGHKPANKHHPNKPLEEQSPA